MTAVIVSSRVWLVAHLARDSGEAAGWLVYSSLVTLIFTGRQAAGAAAAAAGCCIVVCWCRS